MKKRYQITLRTIYGSLTIDDIEAKTQEILDKYGYPMSHTGYSGGEPERA